MSDEDRVASKLMKAGEYAVDGRLPAQGGGLNAVDAYGVEREGALRVDKLVKRLALQHALVEHAHGAQRDDFVAFFGSETGGLRVEDGVGEATKQLGRPRSGPRVGVQQVKIVVDGPPFGREPPPWSVLPQRCCREVECHPGGVLSAGSRGEASAVALQHVRQRRLPLGPSGQYRDMSPRVEERSRYRGAVPANVQHHLALLRFDGAA